MCTVYASPYCIQGRRLISKECQNDSYNVDLGAGQAYAADNIVEGTYGEGTGILDNLGHYGSGMYAGTPYESSCHRKTLG